MRTRPVSLILFTLLLTFISTGTTARAFEDEPDDYDVKARVIRISLIGGEVTLKRSGNTEWERARLNFPLVEGDTIATDRDGRLDIQLDARNFVRLGSKSVMRIVTLRDEGVAFSVIEGTAVIRLAKFDRQKEYFELDAPRSTLAAEKKGLYRVDVAREGRVRFTVRDGGSARVYSDTSGFPLRDGRSAELIFEGDNAGDWEFVAANTQDAIDKWVDDRERYLAQRLRHDVQYYDAYVWGAEDLDAYGDWVSRLTTDGFGDRAGPPLASITIGHLIDMDIGPGVRRMVGPGLATNRGVGLHITTAVGSITTTSGPGVREAVIIEIEVGGDQHW